MARIALRHPGAFVGPFAGDRAVRILQNTADLEPLRAEWRGLRTEVSSSSAELDWAVAHGDALPDGERLCVVTVYARGRLTGVAPLIETLGRPPRHRLRSVDGGGLLYADDQQLDRLAEAVLGLGLPVCFDSVAPDSHTEELLRTQDSILVRRTRWIGGPSQPLDGRYADPLAELSSRKRNDLRRKRRKAEQYGEVSFEMYVPDDDFGERFEEFVGIEGSGWKTREGTALADDAWQRAVLWRYASAPAVRDRVRIATMRIGDRVVAADLAVIAGNRYWFYKGGYDVEYAACSPGILLKVFAMGWAAEHGLERFEFMGEPERYKLAWGAEPQEHHLMTVYPRSASGVIALGADARVKAASAWARRREARADGDGDGVGDGANPAVELLSELDDLEALRPEWDTLEPDLPGPSSELDFTLARREALDAGERLCVVTVREQDRLAAVAPLLRSGDRFGRLRLVDDDASGFRFMDFSSHAGLIDAILDLRRPLRLDTLPAGSRTEELLVRRAKRRALVRSQTRLGGPAIELDPTWKEPLDKLKGRRRKDLRRRRRKAEALGPVRFEVVAPGDDLAELWGEFVRVEASGWKLRNGTALACGTQEHDLTWAYVSRPQVADRVRFVTMRIGENLVAVDLTVLAGNRIWVLKGAYDEAYRACSPGMWNLIHTLSWAAGQGLDRYEFMGADEAYKREWGSAPRALRSVKVYPPTPAGIATLTADLAGKGRRIAARRIAALRERADA